MAEPTAYARVLVQGAGVEATVRSVEIEDDDRLIDKATIVFDDPRGVAADVMRENQTVRIDLGWSGDGNHAVLFEGVTAVPAVTSDARGTRVTVTAFDLAYKLMKTTAPPGTAPYTGKLSAILASVVQRGAPEIGMGDVVPDPDREYVAADNLAQRDRPDWNFVQDLAVAHHARAFVEVNGEVSRFYFVPEERLLQAESQGSLTYCRGYGKLVSFRYQSAASAASPARSVRAVDPRSGEVIAADPPPPEPDPPPEASDRTAAAVRGLDGSAAGAAYAAAVANAATAADGPSGQRAADGPPAVSDPANETAKAKPDPTRRRGQTGEGIAIGNPSLRAKGKITIVGVAPWAEGDWYVCKVVHRYARTRSGEREAASYETRLVVTR